MAHEVIFVKVFGYVRGYTRRWWPVYARPHRNKELGVVGRQLHYHVAWNRFPERLLYRYHKKIARGMILLHSHVVETKRPQLPVLSKGRAPKPSAAWRRVMIDHWKKEQQKNSKKGRAHARSYRR